VLFWSEEHATAFRKKTHRARGAYFLPEQMAYATRIFGFMASCVQAWLSAAWSLSYPFGKCRFGGALQEFACDL